jgi:integrase
MHSIGNPDNGERGWRQIAVEQTRQGFEASLYSSQPTKLLTVSGLAEELQCSTSFVYRHTQNNASDPIPVACWIGNRPRFKLADVEIWLQARKPSPNCDNLAGGSASVRDRRLKRMSRSHSQTGHVRLRTNVCRPYWEGFFRQYSEEHPEGVLKSLKLGFKEEISRKQAQSRLRKVILEKEFEIVRHPQSVMTVKNYVEDHYIPEFVTKRKPSTCRAYLQILQARVLPALGAMELNQVARRDVQLLINRLHGQGKARHTCDNVRTVIRSLFRQAIRDERLTANPATLIQMPQANPRIPTKVPSAEQMQAVLNALEEPYRSLAWFVVVTGCRIGEALGLKWGAINFDDKLVWFLTASYAGEEHLTKGHRSNKPLYLTDAEISRLRELKSLSPNSTESDFVFPDRKHPGRPMTEQNALRCGLMRAAEKIGIHLTWHQLRHWSGTMLYRAGVPIKIIQARLGHSRWQTTADWYVETDIEGEREAAMVASRLLEVGNRKQDDSSQIVSATVSAKLDKEGESC